MKVLKKEIDEANASLALTMQARSKEAARNELIRIFRELAHADLGAEEKVEYFCGFCASKAQNSADFSGFTEIKLLFGNGKAKDFYDSCKVEWLQTRPSILDAAAPYGSSV